MQIIFKLILIGLVVFLGVAGFKYLKSDKLPWLGNKEATKTETGNGVYIEENALVINDHQPGDTITAATILLTKPGYLVVHELENGAPGKIIGSSKLLPSGESQNISVKLTRAGKDGESFFGMLHFEGDDNSTFDAAKDKPVPSKLEGPIMSLFTMTTDAAPATDVTL
jgi:hypothetical protein